MRVPRRAFTLIEVLMVVALIGIVAGWAYTRVNIVGYRMDAGIRMLQNTIIGAQQTAITRGTEVTLRFDRQNHKIETRFMLNGSEKVTTRALPEGSRFLIPASGIDGQPSDFVGGLGASDVGGVTYARDVVIAANGSIPKGDVVIYLGSTDARPTDRRALAITGATTRTAFWSFGSGAWARRDY